MRHVQVLTVPKKDHISGLNKHANYDAGFIMGAAQLVAGALLAAYVPADSSRLPQGWGLIGGLLAVLCVFMLAFGLSWAPLGGLVPVEIQPLETRSPAYGIW